MYKIKRFGALETDLTDDEFLDWIDHSTKVNNNPKLIKSTLSGLGAVGGSGLGLALGAIAKKPKTGLALGTALGSGVGYLGGSKVHKMNNAEVEKFKDRYKKADEETKRNMRRDYGKGWNNGTDTGYLGHVINDNKRNK